MSSIAPKNTWETSSPADTREVAAKLITGRDGPVVVALNGPLGSGKTTFVRGVVEACGGVEEPVRSPTFTLLNPYETDPPVYHADLYRTGSWQEQQTIGLEEYFERGIVLVEWAERWQGRWPARFDWIHFEYIDEETRRIIHYHRNSENKLKFEKDVLNAACD